MTDRGRYVSARQMVRRSLERAGLQVTNLDGAGLAQRRRKDRAPLVAVAAPGSGRPTWIAAPADVRSRPGRHQVQVGRYLEAEFLGWLTDALKINCVIDVGANRGQFGSMLRDSGYSGRIASFEPVAHVLADLREISNSDREWKVFDFALGESDTTTTINVDEKALSSILPPSEFGKKWKPRMAETATQEIGVRRLDGVWDEITAGIDEPRVFLKLDTQGYDLAVFRGAGDRVKDVAALQSEVSSRPIYQGMATLVEQIGEYVAAGFELSAMMPVSYSRGTVRAIEFDAFLVRPDRVPSGRKRRNLG